MDKIDRLVWAVEASFLIHGVRVGIRANNSAALERMAQLLPPGGKVSTVSIVQRLYSALLYEESALRSESAPRSGTRPLNLLYGNWERLARARKPEAVLEAFEEDVQLYVAEHAPRRIFVHAGVVGWKGRAIVIPGRSFSGKSTLTAALVRAGATYYSDEYAVIDGLGRVHPYARPLALREGDEHRSTKYSIETIGGRAGTKALPAGLILVTRFQENARWRPLPLSAGRGALALLENTVSARRVPQRALSTLQQAVQDTTVLQGTRGEAASVVAQILKCAEDGCL